MLSINRTILECKVIIKTCVRSIKHGINRTILECKVFLQFCGPQWGQVLESWDKSSVKRV